MMANFQKLLHTLNLVLRSLIFSSFMIMTTIFYSFLCLIAWFFPLHWRFRLLRHYLRLQFKVLEKVCKIRYIIEGLENIPKDRCGIVLCKHQSTWETFLLPLLFFEPAVILKRELLWVPFFGWGLASSEPIAINRNDKSSAMQQIIEQGKKRLAAGRWIVVFPEGTRVPIGTVKKYHLGGPRLAVATGAPIIPIAHNAGLYWPRRTFIKRPGTIKVVIGNLIESHDQTPEELLSRVQNWIETTVLRLDSTF